jgi:hypothetical protein
MTTSNENNPFDKDATIEQKLLMGKMMIAQGLEKVDGEIDKLTSSALKRIIKIMSHIHIADAILEKHPPVLKKEEQNLIDNIFALQETIFGYTTLNEESRNSEQTLGENVAFTNITNEEPNNGNEVD